MFKKSDKKDGTISITCDGECKNNNFTFHINEGKSIEHWKRHYKTYSFEMWSLEQLLDVDNREICSCKEEIRLEDKHTAIIQQCRVWECLVISNLFKNGSNQFIQSLTTLNQIYKVPYIEEIIDKGFIVSIYLQGSKVLFRGGN